MVGGLNIGSPGKGPIGTRAASLFARIRPRAAWFACLLLSLSFLDSAYGASRDWWWAKNTVRKTKSPITLDLGVRLSTHYNREETLLTPPEAWLAEVQLTYWLKNKFGFYATGGISFLGAQTYAFGGGAKIPFLAMGGKRGFISGISMNLVVDVVYYQTVPPVAPRVYSNSEVAVRYGGSMYWVFGSSRFFLNTTLMATQLSGNFFIAPMVGLGFQF